MAGTQRKSGMQIYFIFHVPFVLVGKNPSLPKNVFSALASKHWMNPSVLLFLFPKYIGKKTHYFSCHNFRQDVLSSAVHEDRGAHPQPPQETRLHRLGFVTLGACISPGRGVSMGPDVGLFGPRERCYNNNWPGLYIYKCVRAHGASCSWCTYVSYLYLACIISIPGMWITLYLVRVPTVLSTVVVSSIRSITPLPYVVAAGGGALICNMWPWTKEGEAGIRTKTRRTTAAVRMYGSYISDL